MTVSESMNKEHGGLCLVVGGVSKDHVIVRNQFVVFVLVAACKEEETRSDGPRRLRESCQGSNP